MKRKKMILIFVITVLITTLLTIPAFAHEEHPEGRTDTSSSYAETASADAGETTEKSEKLRAYLERLMEEKDRETEGDYAYEMSDGTVLYVVPIYEEETPQKTECSSISKK